MNGIIAEGEKSCNCYDCWQVQALQRIASCQA